MQTDRHSSAAAAPLVTVVGADLVAKVSSAANVGRLTAIGFSFSI